MWHDQVNVNAVGYWLTAPIRSDDLIGIVDPVGIGSERVRWIDECVDPTAQEEAVRETRGEKLSHDFTGAVNPTSVTGIRAGRIERVVQVVGLRLCLSRHDQTNDQYCRTAENSLHR